MPEGLEIPPEQWFDPNEGLRTVRGLLDYLRRHPVAPDVAEDLEAMEQVLTAAAEQGVRFHLAVDF